MPLSFSQLNMDPVAVTNIELPIPPNYNLEKSVCNHGFFMMAPNRWNPSEKSLHRPLRLISNDSCSVNVSITQPSNGNILLISILDQNTTTRISSVDREAIKRQVSRMLRVSAEDERMVEEYHNLNPEAKEAGFDRIFRNPTLFEDIIKCILLCYCPWPRSLEMAQALCDLDIKEDKKKTIAGSKRKRCSSVHHRIRNFPSPRDLTTFDEETLKKKCNLGFRASSILKVAAEVLSGKLNLEDFEVPGRDHKSLRNCLISIKGFGPFTASNVLMCLGFYHEIPMDTEATKHLQQIYGITKSGAKEEAKAFAEIYEKYHPFQCLAYWMKQVEYYEKELGKKLSELPHSEYKNVCTLYLQNGRRSQ